MREIDREILIWIEKYKAITIKQASRMFYEGDYRYDRSRKKLKAMEDKQLLKSYINSITKEKVYYVQDKLSAHDIYIFDFYSKLVEHGCANIEFRKEPRFLKGLLRPDAYFQFEFEGYIYYVLLEIDLTHYSTNKLQLYAKLERDGELKNECLVFPQVVIVGVNAIQKEFHNLDIVYLPFNLKRFEKVLGIID